MVSRPWSQSAREVVQVWMALEEKKIPFDTILIDLFNKPEWYPQVASNNQTPAVRLDGENMCESMDIMLVGFPSEPSSAFLLQSLMLPLLFHV
jgi:hypothetical protein